MIIASATANGRRVLMLGVTRENIVRLTAGKPIRLTPETHPGIPADLQIAIVFGETEGDLIQSLRPLMGDDTKVIAVPRGDGKAH